MKDETLLPDFDAWSRRCEIQLLLCNREFREVAEFTWNAACRAALQSGNSGQLNRANSFTDDELMGMAHGDNPVANAYRELLEFRRNSAGGNSAQPVTVPDGLRLALSNAGIAAPESDDMLFATHEKYLQLLVNWVKDRKPFMTSVDHPTKCWCRTCRPVTMNDMRFVVCPDCGNKRCPKANDHRNTCTGSNEPGQPGSAYQDEPKGV